MDCVYYTCASPYTDENYAITYYVDTILSYHGRVVSYECESDLSSKNDVIIIIDIILPEIPNEVLTCCPDHRVCRIIVGPDYRSSTVGICTKYNSNYV